MLEKAGLRQIRIHDPRHTYASLLLQQGESVVYVKEQLGHASIQITVDTYGHLIPGANRGAVDRLDDGVLQASATQAQPQPCEYDRTLRAMQALFGKSGEPRRNRTFNPQIKSFSGAMSTACANSFLSENHGNSLAPLSTAAPASAVSAP